MPYDNQEGPNYTDEAYFRERIQEILGHLENEEIDKDTAEADIVDEAKQVEDWW